MNMQLPKLEEIAETFQSVETDLRLELLLDYARKLPPLPDRYAEARAAGVNRVPECVTPVFLFSELDGDRMRLHVEVAEEAPTVKGLMSIIVNGVSGEPAERIATLPNDLLMRLGLHQCIGSQRTMGFSGILERVRRLARQAATQGATADASRN